MTANNSMQQTALRTAAVATHQRDGQMGVRQPIARENDYAQAGERYRAFSDWERDELIRNLVDQLAVCEPDTQERTIAQLSACDGEYGRRVAEGLAVVRPEAPVGGQGAPARLGSMAATEAR